MSKIRNVTGEDRTLPWLGNRLVLAGQVVEVSDEDVYNYTQQSCWDPADSDAQALHDDAHAAENPAPLEQPAGNASRDEWVAYVVATGRATDADLADLSRDEIRDTYKEQA